MSNLKKQCGVFAVAVSLLVASAGALGQGTAQPPDWVQRAFHQVLEAARSGVAEAQYALGLSYAEYTHGFKQNLGFSLSGEWLAARALDTKAWLAQQSAGWGS